MDTTDPAAYTTIGGEPFVTWPLASPTSRLAINIRFYSIDEGEEVGARYRIDLGRENEALLERMYDDFDLAAKGVSAKQFEETVREMFQQRLAFINAYGIATTLYVAFTTDPKEMRRLMSREQKVLASQSRRFPYMAYEQYRPKLTTLRAEVKRFFGTLRALLFH